MELEGDVEALRAQLGEQRAEQQGSGRERARALSELSEQNLRLSQQLAQVGEPTLCPRQNEGGCLCPSVGVGALGLGSRLRAS